ncbi:MAG: uroporphyrinogen-III C-methyltransferase [Dokdonella sp.]
METNTPETSPVAKSAPPPPMPALKPVSNPPRRGGGGIFTGMLVLVALLFSGYSLWRVEQSRKSVDNGQTQAMIALEQQVDSATQANQQLRGDLDTLRSRFRDADTVNKGLREEMLAIGERSRNLDDAVANLAEQRLTGRDALALNEAEFLLMMANERYQLFGDANAATQGLQLADSALAASQDPIFSGVRATITAERDAIAAGQDSATRATLRSLGTLADGAGDWPMRNSEPAEDTDPQASRFSRVFSRFVRIRHGDETLAAREPTLARSLLRIDLHAATAAWLAREKGDYQAALQRARNDIVASFDDAAAPVQAALAEVDRLAAQPVAPPLAVLGTALKELRDLRATRALSRQPMEAMPAPAVPPVTESVAPPSTPALVKPSDVAPTPAPAAPAVDPNKGATL